MNRDLSLGERLLLHIRAGGWHTVASVRDGLESFTPPDCARERYRQAVLSTATLPQGATEQGRDLLVEDAVAEMCRRDLLERRHSAAGDEVRATPRKDERFDLDPEFQNLLPRAADEVGALETLVLREGCRDALTVWEGHDLLIDGYSRWALLSLLGWPCAIVYLEFADRDGVMTWIWQQHCGRRNLTPEARSYAHGRDYNAVKRQRGGDRAAKSQCETLGWPAGEPSESQRETLGRLAGAPAKSQCETSRRVADELASRYGIARATLYRDARFAAALDRVVAICGPAIRQVVLSQEVGVSRKQVLALAQLPAAVQRCVAHEILTSRKPPRLAERDTDIALHLSMPLDKPAAQAALLAKKLGPTGLRALLLEIDLLLSASRRGNNGQRVDGRAFSDVHVGRIPAGADTRTDQAGRQHHASELVHSLTAT